MNKSDIEKQNNIIKEFFIVCSVLIIIGFVLGPLLLILILPLIVDPAVNKTKMNVLVDVERVLLANVTRTYEELKSIDDKTMQGLAFFYGFETLLSAIHLLEHTNRLCLYQTVEKSNVIQRRLYQFHANKNQISIYTLPTSNFCTCTFYREHILNKQDYFACPHNIAIKLLEHMFKSNVKNIEIETFDVSHEFLMNKMTQLVEQACEME